MNELMSVTQSQIALYRAIANSERVDRSKNAADLLEPTLKVVPPTIKENRDVFNAIDDDDLIEVNSVEMNDVQNYEEEQISPELVNEPSETAHTVHGDNHSVLSVRPDLHKAEVASQSDEIDMEAEKKLLMREFHSLRAQHPSIIQPDDRVNPNSHFDDVQLALAQAKNSVEVCAGTDTLKDGLRIGTTGLEYIAPKITRKMVNLNGWSTEVTADVNSGRYDTVLAALYRKYWRSGSGGIASNPLMQLLFMLLASAGIFAFKQKFDMPGASASAQSSKPASPPSFESPSSFAEEAPKEHNRPRMRPPREDTKPAPASPGFDMSSIAASIGPAMSMMSTMGPMMQNVAPMMAMAK